MEQFPSAGINHNYFGLLSNKKHQLLVTRTHSDYSATIRVSQGSRDQYFILFIPVSYSFSIYRLVYFRLKMTQTQF